MVLKKSVEFKNSTLFCFSKYIESTLTVDEF